MGSITPLLDTLLHQVLGRQLSLDAHARQPLGPTAVPAVIRDSATEDAAHALSDSSVEESQGSEDADFAGSMATARSREQSSESSVATSSVRRTASSADAMTPLPNVSSAASAQLALSDTARVLNEQARLAGQQSLLLDILQDSSALPAKAVSPSFVVTSSELQGKPASSPLMQPTMLLPLAEQASSVAVHGNNASLPPIQVHSNVATEPSVLSPSDSASLDVSQAARQMNQWTAVLLGQDWQSVLSAETMDIMPLSLLSTAVITDTLGQDIAATAQRDILSHSLATALKTSGLFHEALLAKWGAGQLPLETIEQSARQRQQLLSVLPAAPEFGDAVIRQQLQMMAGQSIHFQSELWAGAMMLMSFRTEPYLSAGHDDSRTERRFPAFPDQRRIWTLTLTFELPALGTVTAGIQWDGELLSVTLGADREVTRNVLSEDREALEQLLNDSHHSGRTVHIDDEKELKAATFGQKGNDNDGCA